MAQWGEEQRTGRVRQNPKDASLSFHTKVVYTEATVTITGEVTNVNRIATTISSSCVCALSPPRLRQQIESHAAALGLTPQDPTLPAAGLRPYKDLRRRDDSS